MTRSRAPLLELTLFVSDLDRSMTFISSLGLNVEAWPGEEDTTADVTLSSPDAPDRNHNYASVLAVYSSVRHALCGYPRVRSFPTISRSDRSFASSETPKTYLSTVEREL